MLISYFISVFVHILSAVVWLGAVVMSVSVLRRAGSLDGTEYLEYLRNFRWINRTALFSLTVTGLYNLFARGYTWFDLVDPVFWNGYFGETLMIKLIVFSTVLTSAISMDMAIGNVLIRSESVGKGAELCRRRFSMGLTFNLIGGVLILFCAIMLVRGRPW